MSTSHKWVDFREIKSNARRTGNDTLCAYVVALEYLLFWGYETAAYSTTEDVRSISNTIPENDFHYAYFVELGRKLEADLNVLCSEAAWFRMGQLNNLNDSILKLNHTIVQAIYEYH